MGSIFAEKDLPEDKVKKNSDEDDIYSELDDSVEDPDFKNIGSKEESDSESEGSSEIDDNDESGINNNDKSGTVGVILPSTANKGTKDKTENKEKEKTEGKLKYKCDSCNRQFVKHSQKCSKNLHCLKCGKKLKNLKSFKRHVKTKHMTGTLQCETCQQMFKSKSKLATHMKTHTVNKKATCPVCNKEFKNKGVLSAHKARDHRKTAKPKREWKCKLCSKVYESDRGLRYHMENHKKVGRQEGVTGEDSVAVVVEDNDSMEFLIVEHEGVAVNETHNEVEAVESNTLVVEENIDNVVLL